MSMRPCVRPKTLLTRHLEKLGQISTKLISMMHNETDECFTFWGQKVKGQGHGVIKCAGKALLGLVNTIY